MTDSEPKQDHIDVGKTDDELRLWRATAAVRHAEARLASQASNRAGLEARATSIIGWSVPVGLAAVALAVNPAIPWIDRPAWAVVPCVLAAAALACAALWPRRWSVVGVPPADILTSDLASELEFQERFAADYGVGVAENQRQLFVLGWLIRLAWTAMALAPVLAALAAWSAYPVPVLRGAGESTTTGLTTPPLTSCKRTEVGLDGGGGGAFFVIGTG